MFSLSCSQSVINRGGLRWVQVFVCTVGEAWHEGDLILHFSDIFNFCAGCLIFPTSSDPCPFFLTYTLLFYLICGCWCWQQFIQACTHLQWYLCIYCPQLAKRSSAVTVTNHRKSFSLIKYVFMIFLIKIHTLIIITIKNYFNWIVCLLIVLLNNLINYNNNHMYDFITFHLIKINQLILINHQ